MPDGRRDSYSKTTEGYNHPYQVFNTLTKIAENHFELRFPDDTVFVYNIPLGTTSLQPFLIEIRDPHGQKLTFGYDLNVRLTTITDALGRATTLTYNVQGLVTQAMDPFGRFATFEYDANRNLVKITDMAGYSSSLSYDKDVFLRRIDKPQGRWDFYIEPADGVMAFSDDYPPPGEHTWQSYRITTTNPAGDKEEHFYHGGCGTAVGINACGYSWYISPKDYVPYTSGSVNNFRTAPKAVYFMDAISGRGEIKKIIDPEGGFISYGYDSYGNRTSIQDANGNTTSLVYDANGNMTMITDPLGSKAQLTYDSSNNLTKLIDPGGNIYQYEYNGKDLTKITDPKSDVTSFTYNSYGKLTQLKDAKNNSISFTYDSSGNLLTSINPVGGTHSYTYDGKGRVISYTDPMTNTKSFTYDAMNRLIEVRYPDQSVKSYHYDCCTLSRITDSTGTLSFLYDDLRRLKSFTDIYGKTISYGYDKFGNLTTLTYPDGKIVSYEYDKAGRLTKVTDWLNNVTTYEYDLAGNLTKTAYPNGSLITYQYDQANRFKSILDFRTDASVNAAFSYSLDALGNRTAISFYQPLNVIPSLSNLSYTYDADNRILTVLGNTSLDYDNNGNLIKKTLGSNVTTYGWNHNNMLTHITKDGNTYSYKYDGFGNRVAKIESSVETRYVIDLHSVLSKVLAEIDVDGNITAYYVYGLGLVSKITHDSQAYFYHFDGIGSSIGITDMTGEMVNNYAYDAFGKALSQTEAIPNPFKYIGRFGVMDEGNGLMYMRARYYDPEIGRFINKDPIGLSGGINLFTYVGNNPINFTDPQGLLGGDTLITWLAKRAAIFLSQLPEIWGDPMEEGGKLESASIKYKRRFYINCLQDCNLSCGDCRKMCANKAEAWVRYCYGGDWGAGPFKCAISP
jgi:RHS repeat-associated protein